MESEESKVHAAAAGFAAFALVTQLIERLIAKDALSPDEKDLLLREAADSLRGEAEPNRSAAAMIDALRH